MDGEFLSLYSYFSEVVVVNLDPQTILQIPSGIRLRSMVADGRSLPFETGSFEWVFSNAVIEHVGGWKDQVRFAQEIRRVAAKGDSSRPRIAISRSSRILLSRSFSFFRPRFSGESHHIPRDIFVATKRSTSFPHRKCKSFSPRHASSLSELR